jgi:hypothetical protein
MSREIPRDDTACTSGDVRGHDDWKTNEPQRETRPERALSEILRDSLVSRRHVRVPPPPKRAPSDVKVCRWVREHDKPVCPREADDSCFASEHDCPARAWWHQHARYCDEKLCLWRDPQ